MITDVVKWSINHRKGVLITTATLAVAAAAFGAQLQLDALPDLTPNQVLVLTRAPGLTPEEVERLVTRPVELALGGVPRLTEQRSLSRYGLSAVTAVFDDDMPPYLARQVVQERLTSLAGTLPVGVESPELGPLSGGLGEIFQFTLSSSERSPAGLLELATLQVAPLLRAVPGIVEVNTWGGEQRTLEVQADPIRLAQRGLTLDDLRRSLEESIGSVPGATLSAGTGQVLLRGVSRPDNRSDLGAVLVEPAHAGPLTPSVTRVSDVATVAPGALTRIGAATANGRGETVYLMAQMLRGENALEVMQRVHAKMEDVRVALPADVRLDVVYDRSVLVGHTLRTVAHNLLEGAALVIIVLFAMLGSSRAGLLVALAIPLSMLGAASAMVALGIPGNLMSLGAIDFGLLVDGAVVMVEALFHTLHEHRRDPEDQLVNTLRASAGRVARPVFFSVLVILLVYVPILSLTGVDGKMFRPMALTVAFALLTALVLSLTFIPAAAVAFLRPKDVPERDPWLVRVLGGAHRWLLDRTTIHPVIVGTTSLLLLLVGGFIVTRLGTEFTPQLDEGDLVIQTTRAPDISLESAIQDAGRFEAALVGHIPEVLQVVSRIGSPAVATDVMGIEQADVFVKLRPRDEWRPGLTLAGLVQDIERALEERAPGGEPSFTMPIQMRFNELIGGAVTDVAISIYGEDLAELQRLARSVVSLVEKVPGAVDARVLAPPDTLLVEVRPRPLEGGRVGLTNREILDSVQAVRTGVEVGATWDGPIRIPINVRSGETSDAFSIDRLPLATANGSVLPLDAVANVSRTMSPSSVARQNAARRILVGFNVRGGDLGTVVEEARRQVSTGLKLPAGFRVEWGGQYETLNAAKRRLMLVVPLVVVLIMGTLFAAFRHLRPALIISTHVPFACVGGVLALAARDLPVSMPAAIGFIALSGVAVLNGVVLMSRLIELEKQGLGAAIAAITAARERARPVLTTALVAALGFVPMMLATGVGAEVQRPLATVVVGGLVTSTVLTLLILPTLYPRFAGHK